MSSKSKRTSSNNTKRGVEEVLNTTGTKPTSPATTPTTAADVSSPVPPPTKIPNKPSNAAGPTKYGAVVVHDSSKDERLVVTDSDHFAFFVQHDKVVFDERIYEAPDLPAKVDAAVTTINTVCRAVGRVEWGDDLQYVGTGWLVQCNQEVTQGRPVIMTNRHVYDGMTRKLQQDPSTVFSFNLDRELGQQEGDSLSCNRFTIAVTEQNTPMTVYPVNWEDPDAVLLYLENGPSNRPNLALDELKAPLSPNDQVFVIGYPGPTPESDPEAVRAMYNAFGPRLGYKRFAAGGLMRCDPQDDRKWWHDVSTLGGNSGSPVVRLTGKMVEVVGIHYAGETFKANYMWTTASLMQKFPCLDPKNAPTDMMVESMTNSTPSLEQIEVLKKYYKGYDANFLGVQLALPKAPANQQEADTLPYVHHTVLFNRTRKAPWLSACNVHGALFYNVTRQNTKWVFDPRVPTERQLGDRFYSGSGFDRGHQTRRQDVCWGFTKEEATAGQDATFCFTNSCPQAPEFNQRPEWWQGLEQYVLEQHALAKNDTLAPVDKMVSVITGPVLRDDTDPVYTNKGVKVQVPRAFWKVVCCKLGGSELPQVRVACFVMSQKGRLLRDGHTMVESFVYGDEEDSSKWKMYQVTVNSLEQMTGLQFSSVFHQSDVMLKRPAEIIGGGEEAVAEGTPARRIVNKMAGKKLRSLSDIITRPIHTQPTAAVSTTPSSSTTMEGVMSMFQRAAAVSQQQQQLAIAAASAINPQQQQAGLQWGFFVPFPVHP